MPLSMRLERRNANEEEEKGKGGMYLWLLDRDGVINEDVGSPGVIDVDRFKFLPFVKESLWSIEGDRMLMNHQLVKQMLLFAKLF